MVSDTSYEGYEDIPRQVMLGYTLMAYEAVSEMTQAGLRPSHVFLQCGVGGMAAAVIAQIAEQLASDLPRFVAVEPENADCVMASLREGTPIPAAGDLDTVMAGLSCGEVSILAWRVLATALSAAMTVPETLVPEAMRSLADRAWAATPVVAGESAVAGVCGAIIAARDTDMRAALDLNPDSRILVFGTEGATDPAFYAQTVGRTAAEVSLSGD